jgi:hypothetical protein
LSHEAADWLSEFGHLSMWISIAFFTGNQGKNTLLLEKNRENGAEIALFT